MDASGILLSGGSMANTTALIVARNHMLPNVRTNGIYSLKKQPVMYCSEETHSCVIKAAEVIGLGTNGLKIISVHDDYTICTSELENQIKNDILNGFQPFCIVGNCGTVNTGAVDDIEKLREIADKYSLWLHIDGAFGALAKLSNSFKDSLKSIENADSVAFDLHKWLYMPYEVGCILIKNKEAHRNSFSLTPKYLLNHERGLASGPDSINNYGIELSRGFKALKIWMSLKEKGIDKYAQQIQKNIDQAFYLGELVQKSSELELLTPVTMNIVCFRYKFNGLSTTKQNEYNKEIVMTLQEKGIASPSSTILKGLYSIRVAITNQRSKQEDFDILIKSVLTIGRKLIALEQI
jgi:glutamate/tyrosine decarboxylase-like PLP-dependent enzyme